MVENGLVVQEKELRHHQRIVQRQISLRAFREPAGLIAPRFIGAQFLYLFVKRKTVLKFVQFFNAQSRIFMTAVLPNQMFVFTFYVNAHRVFQLQKLYEVLGIMRKWPAKTIFQAVAVNIENAGYNG